MSFSPSPRRGRLVAVTLVGLTVAALFHVAWVGVRGMQAVEHLRGAENSSRTLLTTATDGTGDPAELAREIADHAAAARSLTSDPLWELTERLPWAGPQLAAVSQLAESLDELSRGVLVPLQRALPADGLDGLVPASGAVDLPALQAIATVTPAARAVAVRVQETLDDVDTSVLLGAVATEFEQARGSVARVVDLVAVVDDWARLLPPFLGADEPRDYVVMVQNNAELRSLGGMPGAFLQLRIDKGRFILGEQYTALELAADLPDGELDPEIREVFGPIDRLVSASTSAPDFATAASIVQRFWTATTGEPADGVLSLDPVALSYLLRATGPLALPDGSTLRSGTAVQQLMHEVYLDRDAAAQDEYFAGAAAAVFTAVAGGQVDPAVLVGELARAVQERRLLVWSADPDEQRLLDARSLTGALPRGTEFGVYLNDGTGSKMDWFLDASAELVPDGEGSLDLVLRLQNTAPDGVVDLPGAVTGGGGYGVPAGVIRTVVHLYLPEGSAPIALAPGRFAPFTPGRHAGRQVLSTWVDLAPGESAKAVVTVPLPSMTPTLVTTPLLPR